MPYRTYLVKVSLACGEILALERFSEVVERSRKAIEGTPVKSIDVVQRANAEIRWTMTLQTAGVGSATLLGLSIVGGIMPRGEDLSQASVEVSPVAESQPPPPSKGLLAQ